MDYSYEYQLDTPAAILVMLFSLVVTVFYVYCMWRLFEKASKPGWAALIPIYNTLVQLEIIQRPWWWLLLMFVPLVNFIIAVTVIFDLAKAFGKDTAFGFGILFLAPIFIPILALGSAKYVGREISTQ